MATLALPVATPVLPAPDAWHQTPIARMIVADMHRLTALSMDLADRYGGTDLATVYWQIGTLEVVRRHDRPARYEADGTVAELLSQLEVLREDAIERAQLAAFPARWWDCEAAYDAYADTLEHHIEAVAQAIDAEVVA